MALEVVSMVNNEVKIGKDFITKEYDIILDWADKVELSQLEMNDVDLVISYFKDDDNDMIRILKEVMNELIEACEDFLEHILGKGKEEFK